MVYAQALLPDLLPQSAERLGGDAACYVAIEEVSTHNLLKGSIGTDKYCYHNVIALHVFPWLYYYMNRSHRKTLMDIYSQPVPATLEWRRIEALFVSLGAETVEGAGSRVRFVLNGVIATFHRPHPAKEAKPYQVRDAKTFLENAGVKP